MDFTYTPEQEQFRAEIRRWLAANLTDDLRIEDPTDERVAPDRETFERRRDWQRRMFAAGWVGISWPKEYGGRGATLMEQVIYDEECFRARAPVLPGYSGIGMAGPTIIEWGTPAQKRRYLPRILGGDDIWCQGYSEPGAGSDLASLSTRADDRGDHFVVNGQKVWTSGAQFADWIYLLVRTDHGAPSRAAQRPPALQRSLLRGRGGAQGQPDRPPERGVEARDDHAHVRAQERRRARP